MNVRRWLACLLVGVESVCANSPDAVLNYWFGESAGPKLWFSGGKQIDQEIREQFDSWAMAASEGELGHWAQTPQGRLALIVLLDQFPRNIFRGSPEAFTYDAQARALVLEGLVHREDLALEPLQRSFFYLPLEHAENLQLQDMCVELYSELAQDASPDVQPYLMAFLEYAVRHRNIIARFGRFPHRNETMGRTSSREEIAFLETPGASF